ncbi:MAG: serine/threonine-protein kinase [Myxococcaceae bacterium]
MPCVDPATWSDRIKDLAQGRLSADAELAVREHAATCETCAPQLAVVDQKRRLARDAPTQELSAMQLPRPMEPAPVLERGSTVGRFVILDTLGMGGMGAVYSAWDPNLDRKVALKTLHFTASSDPTAHGRMLREAQAMARLSHPNVVNVFEVGEHQGAIFIAMELVAGVTLRTWERTKQRGWREVVQIFLQAGRGLAAAHAAHLVHRDFKPGNVLLGDDGRVRVTDFGVARADGSLEQIGPMPYASHEDSGRLRTTTDEHPLPPAAFSSSPSGITGPQTGSGVFASSTSGITGSPGLATGEPLTRGDVIVGTVGYMSPEQAQARIPDARSDQFAFCICLWEALYGKRPFQGASVAETTSLLLKGELPPRPRTTEAPAWLHSILLRGLAREPEQRYASMEALLADLERAPEDWKRRAGPIAAAVVLVAGIAAIPLVTRAQQQSKCDAVAHELDGVWDDGARAKVTEAFDRVKKPFTTAALASTRRALDAHAKAWADAASTSCQQALVQRELPEADYRLETACLAQRKRELSAMVTLLEAADDAVVERSGTLSWSLTPVKVCTQLARLKTDPRLLESTTDARIASLQEGLARARSLIDAGKLADAEPLVAQALSTSKDLGRRALEAEALSLQALLHQAGAKYAESAEAWSRTAFAAQAAGFDELLATASIHLITVVGFQLNRPAEGRSWDGLARATIERMGGDDLLSLERKMAIARVGNVEGKPLEVAQQHADALAAAKALLGDDHPLLWKVEFDYGSSLVAAKDPLGAVVHLERALQLRAREVSDDHPEVAMVRSTLANAYFFAGRPKESHDAFAAALATRERLFGVDSPRLIVTLNNFGDTLSKAGQHEEGETLVLRAYALAKKAYPPSHPYVLATALTDAEILLALKHYEPALARVDEVLQVQPPPNAPILAEGAAVRALVLLGQGKAKDALGWAMKGVEAGTQVGPRSGELVLPLLARAEAELTLNDAAAAVKSAELALSLVEETRQWPVYAADARFVLARALVASKGDAVRAKTLAEEAQRLLLATVGQAERSERVAAFLK